MWLFHQLPDFGGFAGDGGVGGGTGDGRRDVCQLRRLWPPLHRLGHRRPDELLRGRNGWRGLFRTLNARLKNSEFFEYSKILAPKIIKYLGRKIGWPLGLRGFVVHCVLAAGAGVAAVHYVARTGSLNLGNTHNV